jgi:hypothetical protein
VEFGVRLTVVPTQGEAEVICGLLTANGIPCAHREVELASQAFGGWWNEILVPENRLAEAQELVEPPDTSEPPGEI